MWQTIITSVISSLITAPIVASLAWIAFKGQLRRNSVVNVPYDNGVEIMTSTESEVLTFDDLWRDRFLVSVSVVLPGSWEESVFDVPFVSKAHLVQLRQEAINSPERKKNKEKWEQDIIDLKSLQ